MGMLRAGCLVAALALAAGCQTLSCCGPPPNVPKQGEPIGNVPRELRMVSLPLYDIGPRDILLIESVNNLRRPEEPLRPGDPLVIRVANTIPVDPEDDDLIRQFKQINGLFPIRADGRVDLGPEYGAVLIGGLTLPDAELALTNHLKTVLQAPRVSISLPQPQGRQEIAGEHLVRPDGTVSLGIYGHVYVAGMTVVEARQKIEQHLSESMTDPEVHVDVLAYNSKVYYVIADGGGAGEQVLRFPSTGNETILDAISQINGLPAVASKRHIWLARPAPPELGCDQILPVDWSAIARGADTSTNYQVLPGDRIYVQADHLITFDTFVAKATAPFERVFGFMLLGNGSVRAIHYGHRQFNNSGGGSGVGF
jgi:polysaccharide biosynthesis/export protein